MARKITMNGQSRKSVAEVFEDFVLSQMAQGLSDITIATYRHHIHSISNHLDIQKPLEALTRKDLEAMIVSMRAFGLAHNSISSYCRVLRTFSNWCRRAGLNIPELPKIKDRETVKEAYTDAELLALLKRPKKDCSFCEYRNWVIVNFLMTPLGAQSAFEIMIGNMCYGAGLDPVSAMMSFQMGLEMYLFPYEVAMVLFFFGLGYMETKSTIKMFAVRMVLSFGLMFLVAGYWDLVGLF